MELLGDKYVKAVTEAMTPTGVIVDEYRPGLERLRSRLQLSESDGRTLLGVSARVRLVPLVRDLVEIYKSDTAGTARKAKAKGEVSRDKSGDPISSQDNVLGYMEPGAQKEGGGPNVFMREALNLVDFFAGNYLGDGSGVSIETLERMPVTSLGVVPETELIDTYRHYLITTLSETNEPLRKRYEENERLFALVIGVAPQSRQLVKETLAYNVFKNMLKSALRAREVGPQDLRQFSVLRERLGLSADVSEKIVTRSTGAAVAEHAQSLVDVKDANGVPLVTADTVRRLRTQVALNYLVSFSPLY
jgi:hypothetical protein